MFHPGTLTLPNRDPIFSFRKDVHSLFLLITQRAKLLNADLLTMRVFLLLYEGKITRSRNERVARKSLIGSTLK